MRVHCLMGTPPHRAKFFVYIRPQLKIQPISSLTSTQQNASEWVGQMW